MNRQKRYKLTDYCNNYRKYINDSDKEVFTVKRKTLQNICLLSLELLDDYVNLKRDFGNCSLENSRNKEILKNYLNIVDDEKYKNSILREYFYRCNRAINHINNFKYGMPYTEWVKKSDLLKILGGDKDEENQKRN